MHDKLIRIGVFYDGNYFLHVSNYYNYSHARQSRISISGLHEFIRDQVSKEEGMDSKLCQIVDSHYFRGRLSAQEANQRGNALYNDRVFDDILMSEGITTHYLPLKTSGGRRMEKGIDVWLALEAFELAFYKRFNVLVLIASDGDYVPLVRKLNTLGTRVMVLSWDFEYTTENGEKFLTRTSQDLLEEVTYPVAMHEIIDNRVKKNEPLINNLFVPTENKRSSISQRENTEDEGIRAKILSINKEKGFGFIEYPPNNFFFHRSALVGMDFQDLIVGTNVVFTKGMGDRGVEVAVMVKPL